MELRHKDPQWTITISMLFFCPATQSAWRVRTGNDAKFLYDLNGGGRGSVLLVSYAASFILIIVWHCLNTQVARHLHLETRHGACAQLASTVSMRTKHACVRITQSQ